MISSSERAADGCVRHSADGAYSIYRLQRLPNLGEVLMRAAGSETAGQTICPYGGHVARIRGK